MSFSGCCFLILTLFFLRAHRRTRTITIYFCWNASLSQLSDINKSKNTYTCTTIISIRHRILMKKKFRSIAGQILLYLLKWTLNHVIEKLFSANENIWSIWIKRMKKEMCHRSLAERDKEDSATTPSFQWKITLVHNFC